MAEYEGRAFDWDDEIENDGQEYVILPEGEYQFEVTNLSRERFPGSPKIPPCNKATLTLRVDTDKGVANCRTDLILYSSLEWKISQFFRSIGLKKHGEKLKMNWDKVVGAQGRAYFKPRSWTDNNGNERQANDVDRFLDYDQSKMKIDGTPSSVGDGFMNIPEGAEDAIPF